MSDVDEVVNEFLVESYENLDRLDRDFVTLEQAPDDPEVLARIFRTLHTIKGTCGFLGFPTLEGVAHAGENLLSRLRDRQLVLTPEVTTALLATVDAIREMLGNIERSGTEGSAQYEALVETLTALARGNEPAAEKFPSGTTEAAGADTGEGSGHGDHDRQIPEADDEDGEAESARAGAEEAPDNTEQPGGLEGEESEGEVTELEEPKPLGQLLVEGGHASADDVTLAMSEQHMGDPRPLGEILVQHGVVRKEDVETALRHQAEAKAGAVSDSTIRVDVGLLDNLMNLVGELVLARNQILQFGAERRDVSFVATSQRLNLITSELQEGVMKTRMQPIGKVWSKFPRVARDLAVSCDKDVRIEMDGRDTELDKTILEAIKDPLTHLVRNAVDHGIESPEARVASGKSPQGRLLLRAFHEGGQVIIEISDDGAGIDPERVKRTAIARGVISADQAAHLQGREILNLVFIPGFSTAERVTNISGRGVGMDVVRSHIEEIGGTVDVQSQLGQGTTFRIKIPLTLAIIPALIVTSAGDRYAIPQVSLLELVRLEGDRARGGIEMISGAPVYRLRGKLLPLVYLDRELGLRSAEDTEGVVNIVVLQAEHRQFGLVVDGINDTEEIVVKPLSRLLKGVPLFAGATIMGDGQVALILDVLGTAQRAGVISDVRSRSLAELSEEATCTATERETLLIVAVSRGRRLAIPLSKVARLEEFPAASIETAARGNVVQYRGHILPLLWLGDAVGAGVSVEKVDPLPVVVYSDGTRRVGLVVDSIVDIVEEAVSLEHHTGGAAIAGTSVIQGHVTDVINVAEIVSASGVSACAEHVEARV